ncbi:hypothetical protein ASPCAL07748 [Aspergillus calidoustus]|uniref:Glycine zipper 2TM domain-containing protein n=1 Tax=Aspergillus calidoustus TaxID=454130 RepID=A0A0U5GQC5_ASPCI|nr:hypothetical protein ASPCAL07748 [Aspergillus calidoustus]
MSNRDYYGDNVGAGLARNTTSTHLAMNSSTKPGSEQKVEQYQQPQRQWGDEYRSDVCEPNSNLNTLPEAEGEGERGLGSTGGAFIGHRVGKKSDHGTLGAIGGAVAGAIVANLASNMVKGDTKHGQGQGHGHGGHGLLGSLRDRRIDRLERRLDRRR